MRKLLRLALVLALAAPLSPAVTRQKVVSAPPEFLRLTWVNSDIVACGAVTTCNIPLGDVPARGKLVFAFVRVTGACVGPTTVTVSLGRTAAGYIDWVVASNAKATGVYGDVSGERGTNQTDPFFVDVPSLSATTTVNLQFVSSGGNLNAATACAGEAIAQYQRVP